MDNNNHEDEHEEADTSAMEEPNSVMKEVKRGVFFLNQNHIQAQSETRD